MVTRHYVQVAPVAEWRQVLPDLLAIFDVWVVAAQPAGMANPSSIDVREHDAGVVADGTHAELLSRFLIRDSSHAGALE